LNNPADIIIAFFELVEAEVRGLRHSMEESVNLKTGSLGRFLMRQVGCIGLIVAAVVLVLAALGMLLWSLHLTMINFMSPQLAALLSGLATFALALLLVLIARWLNR